MDLFNFTTDAILEEKQDVPYLRYVLVSVFYVPCVLIILVGNTFVLMAYKRDKRIQENTTNAYILNLALADLLVGVVMVIGAPMHFTGSWNFGELFCIVYWVLDYLATDMSLITIVAISVDRYLMVRNSLKHRSRQSHKKVAVVCCVLWLVCLTVHTTLAFTYSARTDYIQKGSCDIGYGRNLAVLIMLFVVEFLLPVACVLLLNLFVYFHLKRRTTNLQTGRHYRPSVSSAESGRSRSTSEGNSDMRIHGSASTSQHRKAARFLALLLTIFIICWLPYYIEDCYTFVHLSGVHNEVVTQIVSFILWMNSAINPFLYAFTNVFFKDNFMHFMRCRWQL